MSKENAVAFFKKLEEDEDFRDEFIKDPSLEKGKPETILKAAADRGFAFTEAELGTARKEAEDAELSDEDLEKVAGGVGAGVCFVIGYGTWTKGTSLPGALLSVETDENHYRKSYEEIGGAVGFCLGVGLN